MRHELTEGEAGLLVMLFPQLSGLDLEYVEDTGERLRIAARTRTASLACRGCGTVSSRVHDRYVRCLRDLPCGGRPVEMALEVRRFRCPDPGCPAETFAEQVTGLTAWYQRRTAGLRHLLEKTALALAGRAGARLAAESGAAVSRHTLTRLVRALPDPETGQVTVLGVDDVATRKGHAYATVLVDMDSHDVIGMLPDREADTFADWLRAHPGIRVICRDRAGAYARAAREAAPGAVQAADRWHLWHNLAEAAGKTVLACLAAVSPPPGPGEAGTAGPAEPDGFRDSRGIERRVIARHRERYASVQALRAQGCTIRETADRLGLSRNTVLKFASAGSIDELLVKAARRPSVLDSCKPYLNQRRNDGVTSAAALHQEIRARGWAGSVLTVERCLRQFRTADGRDRQARAQPQLTAPAGPALPKPREVTRWLMTHPGDLRGEDAAGLARLLAATPELAAAARHIRSFADMMTGLRGQHLSEWITAVRASQLPALHSFASGLEKDHAAVLSGLTLPYSSGAVEGNNCKIKHLKRLMYGRANFDLLRKMVLLN